MISQRDQDLLNTYRVLRSEPKSAGRLLVELEQTAVKELVERTRAIPELLLSTLEAYDISLNDQDKVGFEHQLRSKFEMTFNWLYSLLFTKQEFTNTAFIGLNQPALAQIRSAFGAARGNSNTEALTAWSQGIAKLEKRLSREKQMPAESVALDPRKRTGKIFVAMPMAADNHSYANNLEAIKQACQEVGFDAQRVDDIQSNQPITDDMLRMIDEADYVIADLTDRRPNVFYEAGYARGIGKTPIYIAAEGTKLDFDIQGYSILFFGPTRQLREKIVARLTGLENGLRARV